MDQGLPGSVVTSGISRNIPDAYLDPSFNPANDRKTGYVTKAILCVPIRSSAPHAVVLGMIQLTNKVSGSDVFEPEDVDVVYKFISLAYPIIFNSQSYSLLCRRGQRPQVGFRDASPSSPLPVTGAISATSSQEEDD